VETLDVPNLDKLIRICSAKIRSEMKTEADREMAANLLEEIYALAKKQHNLINVPHTDEWFEAVRLEAAHQIERHGSEHDAGKTPADWFWLLGYLAGKALAAFLRGDMEKGKHHIISSSAVLLNWHRNVTGDNTSMRPGIDSSDKL